MTLYEIVEMAWVTEVSTRLGVSDIQHQATQNIQSVPQVTQDSFICVKQEEYAWLTCTRYSEDYQLQQAVKRVENVSALHHPRLMTYMGHMVTEEGLFVLEEYVDKVICGDVVNRVQTLQWYAEDYLVRELKEMTGLFAMLQEQGVSHGCISPYSIYMTPDGTLKLSLCHPAPPPFEVYFPPVRRAATTPSTLQNPYKSDVYSLGTVFLAMCLLRDPQLYPLTTLQDSIETELNQLSAYPLLQKILREMMSVNDFSRPDFRRLHMSLSQEGESTVTEPVLCLHCDAELDVSGGALMLWCEPFKHGFCSARCAENYFLEATDDFQKDESAIICRKCGTEIDPLNRADCVRGQANLDSIILRARDKTLCVGDGLPGQKTFQLKCGCYYCQGCLTTRWNYLVRDPLCQKCQQPLDRDQLRSILHHTSYTESTEAT